MTNRYDVVVVGAGPAGSSAALNISRERPDLRILLVDKCEFSRFKLCAGGLTRQAQHYLDRLGVGLPPNTYFIDHVDIKMPSRLYSLPKRKWFAVTTRMVLDNHLLNAVRATTGVEVWEKAQLLRWRQDASGVTLFIGDREVHTQMVVGADGAHGVIRRGLNLSIPRSEMRALETVTAVEPSSGNAQPGLALFDFTHTTHGLNGYSWQFHSSLPDSSRIVLGVGHSVFDREAPPPDLRAILSGMINPLKLIDEPKILGYHVRWYDPSHRHSAPRFILVGDSAGTDPLWGEGITSALEFGLLAARAITDAKARDDFSFSSYDEMIRRSYLGRMLRMKLHLAKTLYRGGATMPPIVAAWAAQQAYRRIASA